MHDFGDYECLNEVASGSTGTVWRARHRELGRVVAVKELSPQLRERPGFHDLFRSEARNLATIDDPHVIRLYDYVEEADRTWMAEEWVDGVRLDRLLQVHGRLTTEQALGVLRGVLQGLAAAHAVRLVHGDVAPSNILVDADGTAKLVDFGLAAPAGSDADPELLGTPAYLSPEAVRRSPRDPRSDIYSAAAVLVELLTGSPPFGGAGGTTVADILRQQVEAPVPALTELGSPLRDLLRRALAKNPDDRPADAVSFLSALEAAAREERGAGWLDRSSVAGVAAGLLAGGVGGATGGMMAGAVMGAVAGGGTSTAGATVLSTAAVTTGTAGSAAGGGVTSSSTIAAEAASTAAKSGSRKLLYLAGGGTTAVVAAGVAAALLVGGSSGFDIAGRYRFQGTTVSTEFTDGRVGHVLPAATWTLSKCHQKPCTGTLASSTGNDYPFSFDGRVLTWTKTGDTTETCSISGLPVQERTRFDVTLLPDTRSGRPTKFTGQSVQTTTAITVPKGCVKGPDKHETTAITLTRVS